MAIQANTSKQARWLDLVQRWQQSKLSVREFCKRHQISEHSFYSWRRLLRQRGLLPDADGGAAPAFVKLDFDTATAAASAIDIVIGRRVLRVRAGFDAELLQKLVQLFEEHAC
jgi:transposase-like protein